MGQYYKPINTNKKESLSSWDYGNGSKLMEHSYIGNDFVGAVERLLLPDGDWYKDRIVWCGDYADPILDGNGQPVKDDNGNELNWYMMLDDDNIINPFVGENNIIDKKYKYILNHDKKEFVNRSKKLSVSWSKDHKINPLPLLLADGNGRGGGDYYGKNMSNVGVWAYDSISIEDKVPEGYTERVVTFHEGN